MGGAGCRRGVAVLSGLRLEAGNDTPHGGANGGLEVGARRGSLASSAGLEGRFRACLRHDGLVGIPAGGPLGNAQGASGDRRLC